jgi:hypothetical protein
VNPRRLLFPSLLLWGALAALPVAAAEGEDQAAPPLDDSPVAPIEPPQAGPLVWDGYYHWSAPPLSSPDWQGLRRDALYFLGYQFGAVAVIYYLPENVSGWTEEDKESYSKERWRHNVSNPVWDDDEWWVNFILHPYWGATYYVRARERGLSEPQAFWFSAFNSALYEYSAEALFEPVSYTDLIVTPVFGWLLGEYLFMPWRESVRANPAAIGTGEKLLLAFTDPLGVLYGLTDKTLGLETSFTLGPMSAEATPPQA